MRAVSLRSRVLSLTGASKCTSFVITVLSIAGIVATFACGGGNTAPTSGSPETPQTPTELHLRATQLSVGSAHACVLTDSAATYCWGNDSWGQLGDGHDNTQANHPVRVLGGLQFASISAGFMHTCALTASGKAYCWGFNRESDANRGALGDGTDTSRTVPTAVVGGLTFRTVVAGGHHTCGITSDGVTYCWGRNTSLELGTGTTTQLQPQRMDPDLHLARLTLGYRYTCGTTTSALAYCWGDNRRGQLGDGTNTTPRTPAPIIGGITFDSLAASLFQEHVCGRTASGLAYCWGQDDNGELGDGHPLEQHSPVPVAGNLILAVVSAGATHSCGLTPNGKAYCWGANVYGELGDGTMTSHSTPVAVAGGLLFKSLGAGGDYTCGLTADGVVYCWGYADYVGDAGDVHRTNPTRVKFF
jgi:alpha-tubulin suppressor-like RCC1 family protein